MAIDRYELLCARVKSSYPRFNVKERGRSWLAPIFWLLQKITRRDYSLFTTTVFSTMYVGTGWPKFSSNDKYKFLRHEMMHIKQFHRWPLGRWAWPINHLIVALCYLFVFPVLWTMRSKFEREGYTQNLLVDYELAGDITELQMEANATWMAQTFGGSDYLFMWRKTPAYAWAMDTQRQIKAGLIANPTDRVEELRVVEPPG